MNKEQTNLKENREKILELVTDLASFLCTILSYFITQNLFSSIFSTTVLFLFIEVKKIITDNCLKRVLIWLSEINKKFIFGLLYFFALLPMIVGWITGEITIIGIEGFIEKFCSNPLQNCLGATIVCSLIKHLSKLNKQEIIELLLQERKNLFDIFLKFSFTASILNATNYKIGDNLPIMNKCNGIHLFIVIFLGAVLLCVFFLRLISKKPIELTATQVYPSWILFFIWAFLASSGLSPFIDVKNEGALLLGNTVLALAIIWVLFILVKRRSTVKEGKYLCMAPVLFSVFAVGNCIINYLFGSEDSNKGMQLISVGGLYISLIIFLIYINITTMENPNSDTDKNNS